MHRLRRDVLFARRGRAAIYNDDHPDDAVANHLKFLLVLDGEPIGTARLDLMQGVAKLRLVVIAEERQRQGHGAVRLIARRENACLLEDAGSRTLEDFRQRHGEVAAITIFARLLGSLQAPSPAPPPGALTPLARHFRGLTERISPAHPDHAEDLAWAAALAHELLASQVGIMPLHGDLHHENILTADGTVWRAIDPHGLIGDPAYDSANFFGNPLGRPDITCDPGRIRRIAQLTAPVIGCDEGKILRYAAAHAALSACWSIDDPMSEEDLSDAFDRLAFLRTVRRMLDV